MSVDWLTVGTSVGSSLVGGGVIGGLVSLKVSQRESKDKQAALALEKAKWEASRKTELRDRLTDLYTATNEALATAEIFSIDLGNPNAAEASLGQSMKKMQEGYKVREKIRFQSDAWALQQYPDLEEALVNVSDEVMTLLFRPGTRLLNSASLFLDTNRLGDLINTCRQQVRTVFHGLSQESETQ